MLTILSSILVFIAYLLHEANSVSSYTEIVVFFYC